MSELQDVLKIVASAEDHASALAQELDSVANRLQEMDMTSSAALSEDEVTTLLDMKARGVSIEEVVQSAELWDALESEIGDSGDSLYDLAETSIRQWGAVEDLGYNDSCDIETLVDEHTEYEEFRSQVMEALSEYSDDPRLADTSFDGDHADSAGRQIRLLADSGGRSSLIDAIKALIGALEEEELIGGAR
jgi:hypothetical protein